MLSLSSLPFPQGLLPSFPLTVHVSTFSCSSPPCVSRLFALLCPSCASSHPPRRRRTRASFPAICHSCVYMPVAYTHVSSAPCFIPILLLLNLCLLAYMTDAIAGISQAVSSHSALIPLRSLGFWTMLLAPRGRCEFAGSGLGCFCLDVGLARAFSEFRELVLVLLLLLLSLVRYTSL